MNISVLTADYAQTDQQGKINAIGLGWSIVPTPLPPHGVAVLFHVDWHEANEKHDFELALVDTDGDLVLVDGSPAVQLNGQFEQGRPPGLVRGTQLIQPFAVNVPAGMPLGPGRYEYRITVGSVEGSASFTVVNPAG